MGNRDEYRIKAHCAVCGKEYRARYNMGSRAKVCPEKKCRYEYKRAASSQYMDQAIDYSHFLTEEELSRFLKWTRSKKCEPARGFVLRFLAETGCRLGESYLIRGSSLRLKDRAPSIKIPTLKRRGRPIRTVFVGKSYAEELAKAKIGSIAPVVRAPRRSVQREFERAMKSLKLDKEGSVHILRHTRASQLLSRGMGVTLVRQQMGWSSLDMLRVYAHADIDKQASILDQLSDL